MNLLTPRTRLLVDLALEEDAGLGDVTSRAIFTSRHRSRAQIEARQCLVICGLEVAAHVFASVDPRLRVRLRANDGDWLDAGDIAMEISGPTSSLLTAERTALNFLQRLSGIATLARQFSKAIPSGRTRIADTRKTTPGFRALEKYAVRCGGCANHRSSLGEHVLIKDNHIAAAGSLERAVAAAREAAPHTARIAVEAASLADVRRACRARAEVILLDNMTPAKIDEAVAFIAGRAIVEVSGGVRLDTVADFARPGVDIISIGAITHSAPAADLSLTVLPATRRSR